MKHLSRTKLQPELGSFGHQIQNMTLKLMPKKLEKNDAAERGIKLISDYANCLTKNASERQEILQLVEYHRSKISDDKKSTLKRSYNMDFLM